MSAKKVGRVVTRQEKVGDMEIVAIYKLRGGRRESGGFWWVHARRNGRTLDLNMGLGTGDSEERTLQQLNSMVDKNIRDLLEAKARSITARYSKALDERRLLEDFLG